MIRPARLTDVPAMADLSAQKRRQYQRYEPTFWRIAEDAREQQIPFFEHMVESDEAVTLVDEDGGRLEGFLIAQLVEAPPVYDPGGLTCMVDDFVVREASLWPTVRESLLERAAELASERGAVQMLVASGHRDQAKRAMLAAFGFSIASEWHVRPMEGSAS